MIFLKTRGKSCDYEYFCEKIFPQNKDWWKKFKGNFYNPNDSHSIFIEIKENKYEFYIDRFWFLNYRDLSGPDRPIGCVFLGSGDCNDENSQFLFNLVSYLFSSADYSFIDEANLLETEGSLTSEYIQSLDSEDGRRHTAETEAEIGCRIKFFSKCLEEFLNEKEEDKFEEDENDEKGISLVSVNLAEPENAKVFLRALKKNLLAGTKHSFFVFTNLPVCKNEFNEFLRTNFDDEVCGIIMTSFKSEEFEKFEIQISVNSNEGKKGKGILLTMKEFATRFFGKIFFLRKLNKQKEE